MLYNKIEIFPTYTKIDDAFRTKMTWLNLEPILDSDNKRIGLLWPLSDCITKQLLTPTIRQAQKWYCLKRKSDNKTLVDYLSYGKIPSDAVKFRSVKRYNIASTYTNCCVEGTGLTYKCADLVGISNLNDGYITSPLHRSSTIGSASQSASLCWRNVTRDMCQCSRIDYNTI